MNYLFIILVSLSSALAFSQDWTQTTFSETGSAQIWVGLSSPQVSEKLALEEAYQEALNEAAKYNFGFNLKTIQNTYSTHKDHKVHQETEWSSKNILFKGVKPLRQKIIKQNNQYIAYREVSYLKSAIDQEQKRLTESTTTDSVKHKKTNQISTYGLLNLKSNNDEVQVILQPKDRPESITVSVPANVSLSTGVYFLFAKKSGMKDIEKEIIVSGGENFVNLDFEPSAATVTFKVFPETAQIKINGKNYPVGTFDLAPGTYTVEASHADFFSKTEEFELLHGQGLFKEIKLSPKKMAISVSSEPSDAAVFINGNQIGTTPVVAYPIQEDGALDVVLVKKGFKMTQQRIPAEANRSLAPLKFKLEKK